MFHGTSYNKYVDLVDAGKRTEHARVWAQAERAKGIDYAYGMNYICIIL